MDTVDRIISFESGELSEEEVIRLFQDLCDALPHPWSGLDKKKWN